MVGVRRFDREAVLDRAAQLFWREGYESASIEDLERVTGLGRGSLYNTFGDKEALFLAALGRYSETEGAFVLSHLDAPDVFDGLDRCLRDMIERLETPGRPRGCLVTNSCLTAGEAGAVEARVSAILHAMEAALATAFRRALHEGQIAPETDVRALARFYCAIFQSLGVMHRAMAQRATLEDIVAVALQAWPGRKPATGA